MAKCSKCHKWCGVVQEDHNYDCVAGAALAEPTETDVLVAKLTPVLMRAAARAGFFAAMTLVGVAVVIGALRFLFSLIAS